MPFTARYSFVTNETHSLTLAWQPSVTAANAAAVVAYSAYQTLIPSCANASDKVDRTCRNNEVEDCVSGVCSHYAGALWRSHLTQQDLSSIYTSADDQIEFVLGLRAGN